MGNLSLGSEGLAVIQEFETFQSKIYDTDGGGHCTIGWGHLVHAGKCDGRENEKVFEKGITLDDANKLLTADTSTAEAAVNQQVKVELTQNQFDALVSFTYNVGSGNLAQMLTGCTDKDGKFDLTKVAERMKLYNKSSGKVLAGLTRRREREASLFEKK